MILQQSVLFLVLTIAVYLHKLTGGKKYELLQLKIKVIVVHVGVFPLQVLLKVL